MRRSPSRLQNSGAMRRQLAEPGAMTEFIVTAYRKPTEHRIRLNQVTEVGAEHDKGRPGTHHQTPARA
jgi:hypothetical protein